jgi:hypothetical protein
MSGQLLANTTSFTPGHYIGKSHVVYNIDDTTRICTRTLPLVELYAKPTLTFQYDSEDDSIETLSIGTHDGFDLPKPFEYRITGVTWYTHNFVNTCNMDSFLSAWVRKMRQTHGKYLKFVTLTDRVSLALHAIADHALNARDRIDSDTVKGMWLTAVLKRSNELDRLTPPPITPPIDCMGWNYYSIFQHLDNHASFEIASMCHCGTVYHLDHILEVSDLKQIEILGDPKKLNYAKMPHCVSCNSPRILLELNPFQNWLLVFNCTNFQPKSPLLINIPKILKLRDVLFKLEYVTYSQEVPNFTARHEVSLQFIRHTWYVYDGAKSPKFFKWRYPRYNYRNAFLASIVYFKI